jgi:hypothetical protein
MATRLRFFDPEGERFGLPTWPWRMAPEGYATRLQLRARGLRPAGQPVAGQLLWYSKRRVRPGRPPQLRQASLYLVELAQPVRPMTDAMWAAHHAAMKARRTCPACLIEQEYVLPTHLGTCLTCADRVALAA